MKPGVVLNPHTPIESIQHILEDIDMVLFMTVNPGFGGQKFITSVVPKVDALSKIIKERGLNIEIEIDGGINAETIIPCAEAGATIFVAGSAIYSKEDRTAALQEIKEAGQAAIANDCCSYAQVDRVMNLLSFAPYKDAEDIFLLVQTEVPII